MPWGFDLKDYEMNDYLDELGEQAIRILSFQDKKIMLDLVNTGQFNPRATRLNHLGIKTVVIGINPLAFHKRNNFGFDISHFYDNLILRNAIIDCYALDLLESGNCLLLELEYKARELSIARKEKVSVFVCQTGIIRWENLVGINGIVVENGEFSSGVFSVRVVRGLREDALFKEDCVVGWDTEESEGKALLAYKEREICLGGNSSSFVSGRLGLLGG
jgi:hypothetical protein